MPAPNRIHNAIVPASQQSLAMRSAALVARGLRDLARDSDWLIKKVFSDHSQQVWISPMGELCRLSSVVRRGADCVVIQEIETRSYMTMLSLPGESFAKTEEPFGSVLAWSPTGRYLVGACKAWGNRLQLFDVHGGNAPASFGDFPDAPRSLAWSETARYFACAAGPGSQARVRLWEASFIGDGGLNLHEALSETGGPRSFEEWFAEQPLDSESSDSGVLSGFGYCAFSPDETTLAAAVEFDGEWADDTIVLLDIPTLRKSRMCQAQGRVTSFAWTFDSRDLIYCSAGQAYRLGAGSAESEALPFGAELVACHPHLPVCLCFSSLLKNSAKGRLFLVNLANLRVCDECSAEGVVDLRWSLDGSKAYGVTSDGLAYIYEPALL